MLEMLRSLFRHQAWADSMILAALRTHPPASEDASLRELLHHILVVQRFFTLLIEGQPFDSAAEMKVPESIEEIEKHFRETHAQELALVDRLQPADLERVLSLPRGNMSPTAGEALTQIVMHSQHHRAQCMSKLRASGGAPPVIDYILWVKDRPAPVWNR